MMAKIGNTDQGTAAAADSDLFTFADFDVASSERSGYSDYSYWKSTFRVFLKNRVALALLVFLAGLLLFTLIQPFLPGQKSPTEIYNDPVIAMMVGVIEVGLGILFGAVWGYVRRLDRLMTEIYNVLSNIPTVIFLLLLAFMMKPGIKTMIIAMSITGWLGMARFIRNQIVIIRDREYNLASRCLGTPTHRIIMKNLLPYLVSVIMMQTALSIPATIGWEVLLTYIGVGLPVSIPSLGNLVNEGRLIMMSPELRYQLVFPVIVVSAITISLYVLGSAFSDASDPRNHV